MRACATTYVTGFLIDQSKIPNYVALTAAAAAGRFNGVPGFDEFGKKAQEDKNNIQPRIGAVYDLRGDGKDVVRAGWGIYYDFGFTNANILFPGLSAQGGSGVVFSVDQLGRDQESRRQLLHGRPARLEHCQPERGESERSVLQHKRRGAADPSAVDEPDVGRLVARVDRIRRCSTSITCMPRDTISASGGRSTRASTALIRRYADLNLNPANPTMNMSIGSSKYDGASTSASDAGWIDTFS